jgi:hypothetical protein
VSLTCALHRSTALQNLMCMKCVAGWCCCGCWRHHHALAALQALRRQDISECRLCGEGVAAQGGVAVSDEERLTLDGDMLSDADKTKFEQPHVQTVLGLYTPFFDCMASAFDSSSPICNEDAWSHYSSK